MRGKVILVDFPVILLASDLKKKKDGWEKVRSSSRGFYLLLRNNKIELHVSGVLNLP